MSNSISQYPTNVIGRTVEEAPPGPLGRVDDPIGWDEYALSLDAAAHDATLPQGVSVYIHLPFCPSRCLNCDHITTVTHDSAVIDQYLAALDQEMTLVTARLGNGRELQQLHLGGGTPNYLSEPQLIRLMSIVERHFRVTDATETSLDASPKRTSRSQLELLRGLGFRRINFEVRDIDIEVQKALGRSHSLPILRDVYDNTRDCAFETISMDLVYGLPNQTLSSMTATLQAIEELAPDRLLCLAFLRRPDIFLHQRSLDPAAMPSLADKMVMFNAIADTLQDASYNWLGLDCFIRDSDPLWMARQNGEVRRNWIGYTSVDTEIVLGFGTGAVSELPGIAVENYTDIGRWSDALWVDRLPIRVGSRLSPTEVEQRRVLNDLMCNMEIKDCSPTVLDDETGPLSRLRERGFIAESGSDSLAVTEQGRFALHQHWGDASPGYRWASGF